MAGKTIPQPLRDIAHQLGVSLRGGGDPTPRLVDASVEKVRRWCDELGPVENFHELIELVAAKLKVHFEVARSDEDLVRVEKQYLGERETGFLNLRQEFDAFTDAVVLRLQHAPTWSAKQYVAVIDARGQKSAKEWFSKWHELAHLIAEPQTKFVFRRTQATRRDPVERLMDQIAGELGFFSDLLLPKMKDFGLDVRRPSLSQMTRFKDEELEFASLQSTFIAILRHCADPAILIEVRVGLNPSEKNRERQGESIEPKLRAITTAHNDSARRKKLFIHRWMRVPSASVITTLANGDRTLEFEPQVECLSAWQSGERSLPKTAVTVEGMCAGSGRVLALIQRA